VSRWGGGEKGGAKDVKTGRAGEKGTIKLSGNKIQKGGKDEHRGGVAIVTGGVVDPDRILLKD